MRATNDGMKICSSCRQSKPVSMYHRDKRLLDGLQCQCIACHNVSKANWRKRDPEGSAISLRKAWINYYRKNKEKRIRAAKNRYLKATTAQVLLRIARQRAKNKNIPFSLTVEDISVPSHCPILGIPLKRSIKILSDNSPSLERIIPRNGYVPGNVMVVSFRANAVRRDASAKELMRIATFWTAMEGKEMMPVEEATCEG